HILGDPTFRFSSSFGFRSPDLSVEDDDYWLALASDEWPSEIRALALHKLYNSDYKGLSDMLLDTYRTSDNYMLRLQCMHLLAHYDDGNYMKLLTLSSDDPYEFIRRKTAHYLGQVGTDEALDVLVKMYLNDINAKRVIFNVVFAAAHFPEGRFVSRLKDYVDSVGFVHNPEKFLEDASKAAASPTGLMKSSDEAIYDSSLSAGRRLMFISGMRNNPYACCADGLLSLVADPTLETSFRVSVTEVLGWYVRAWNRRHIVERLGEILTGGTELPAVLRDEIEKTVGRLNDYLR
ncbi:MAG: HEAT repeat domain-containing protein, partial [Candidatus Cryptobacteroides sp.]